MFSAPPSAAIAGLESLVLAALFLGLGYLIADALLTPRGVDRTIVWALAFPALLGYTLILMVLHMASGGFVLSQPLLVRGVTVVTAGVLVWLRVRRKSSGRRTDHDHRHEGRAMAILVGLGILLWGIVVVLLLPLDYKGDTGLHVGWASSMMAGETTPSGPITGNIPNYYPWMFHSLLTLVAWFTPGLRPYHALGPVQLLQVTCMVLGLFALGKQLTANWRTGAAASLFGALTGGLGFFMLRKLDLVMDPRADNGEAAMRYAGDLVFNRPYNFAFNNLGPPFPRDVTFALLPVFLLLLLLGVRSKKRAPLVGAGGVLGLIWLTHVDSVIVVGGTLALLVLLPNREGMFKAMVTVLLAAGAVWALWTVPIAINYLRFGFDNTVLGPIVLPPLGVLGAWGVITPFAVIGAVKWVPRSFSDPAAKVVAAWTMAAAGMVFVAPLVPKIFGSGFGTLGYQHRYWPFLALGGALYAALGATEVLDRARTWSKPVAIAVVVAVLVFALTSPLLGSLGLYQKQGVEKSERTLLPAALELHASLEGDEDTPLSRLVPEPGMGCTIATAPEIGPGTHAYSGYRHLLYIRTLRSLERYRSGELKGHQLSHIRWRRIYRKRISKDAERVDPNRLLTEGTGSPEEWRAAAQEWGIDAVVANADFAGAPGFAEFEDDWAEQAGEGYVVMWIDRDCA
jgi:hypothetical protein